VLTRPQDAQLPLPPGLIQTPPGERKEDEDKFGPKEELLEGGDIADVTLGQSKPWYAKVLPLIVTLLAGLVGALLLLVGWWHFSLRGLSPAARAYEQMRRLGNLLGVPQPLYQTPIEYGESLINALARSDERNGPRSQQDIRCVVALYVKQRFSKSGLSASEEKELEQYWARVRSQMYRQALKPKWPRRRPASSFWVPPSALRPRSPLE